MSSYKKHMIRTHIYTSTIKKKTKSKLELEQENDSVSATAKSEIPRSNFNFIPKTSRLYVYVLLLTVGIFWHLPAFSQQ